MRFQTLRSWNSSYSESALGRRHSMPGHRPRRGRGQATRLLAHVPAAAGSRRTPISGSPPDGLNVVMRLGDDVLMLDRDDRNVQPDHAACLAREVAGGADHMLACDLALSVIFHSQEAVREIPVTWCCGRFRRRGRARRAPAPGSGRQAGYSRHRMADGITSPSVLQSGMSFTSSGVRKSTSTPMVLRHRHIAGSVHPVLGLGERMLETLRKPTFMPVSSEAPDELTNIWDLADR